MVPNPDVEQYSDGCIPEGYTLNGRLIRPAMVFIQCGNPAAVD